MNIDFTAITPVIEGIAQKLGVTVEYLWGIMVRQAYIDGISEIIWGGIFSILTIISIFIGKTFYKKATANGKIMDLYKLDAEGTVCCLSITIAIICIVFAAIVFTDGLKLFLNPEYKAFKDIVNQFKR